MYPPEIEKLITLFTRFPTIGPRAATRFAFYLAELPPEERDDIVKGIKSLVSVGRCRQCYRSTEENKDICSICSNPKRNKEILCVVERETDLESIEKTKEYGGLYFVLGGTVSPLRKKDFKEVRGEELKKRVSGEVKEVIIATNQNTEGEATALYVERVIKELGVKTSRLGRGLPTGGELEYADEETLSFALKRRI